MYKLDSQAAREADSANTSAFLSETGKYKGKFIRAECLVSRGKGTHGIGFTFEDMSKRTARFDIWTKKGTGDPLFGLKTVNAIMACLRLRELKTSMAMVDRYDYEQRKFIKVEAEVFSDLMNKSIGVVLRNTQYAKVQDGVETGETGWRLELVSPFETETELLASEIMDKATKPEKLAIAMASLADKPLKNKPLTAVKTASHATPSTQASGFDDIDDDIPF